MTAASDPLSRDELLAGLSGRRVSTALYAIETRAGYLCQRARYAAAPAICESAVEQRERAFLAALAAGRGEPAAVTIQQLERFAPQWAHLAPPDPAGRADLAVRLGAKYRFTAADVPRVRAALALDTEPVRRAFRLRHGRELETVYRSDRRRTERLAWWRARWGRRLAELPPFWAAFGLTLTETIGAGTLALPIALAGLGPLPGVALIAVLGLVNVLTIAALAETFTRSGRVRWRGAYLSRLVGELLGPAATAVFTAGLFAFCLAALLAYYIGFSTTLAASTGLAAPAWAAVLLVAVLLLLRRGGLDATVASALVIGAINIGAVLLLSGLAFAHVDPAHLTYRAIPLVNAPLDGAVLGLVFGVVLFAFFGHTSVANCARVVLARDPAGRALIRGAVLATGTAIAVYAVWVLAVGGAVAPARLAAESGTALVPLAEVVGGPVVVVGAVFAVLALGMAAVHFSLGLSNQVREWFGAGPGIGLAPVVAVFVLAEVLLLTGRESFTAVVGLLGALTLPLLAGVFPMLLLLAARRRGECLPAVRPAVLGSAVVVGGLYLVFLGALAVHGLVIWEDPARRVLGLGVTVLVAVLTAVVVRSGRLAPRVVVELRADAETGAAHLHLLARGEPFATALRVRLRDGEDRVQHVRGGMVELPAGAAEVRLELPVGVRALLVRRHSVDPAGRSLPFTGSARLDGHELRLDDGVAEAPLDHPPHEVALAVHRTGADPAGG